MYPVTGAPMTGRMKEMLTAFLNANGLDYDGGISFTCCIMDDEKIAATGSLDGMTVKCVAVSPEYQGMNLTSDVITCLTAEAFSRGERRLMLYTKPGNEAVFRGLGFYTVMRTRECLLMENRPDGLQKHLESLTGRRLPGIAGAIVMNCDPMTEGHRFLMETAAAQTDALYVFVVSEKKGMFPPEARLNAVRETASEMKNVFVYPTGPYMVSSATFPDYFIRDKSRVGAIRCELDIRIFAEKIAPYFGVTRRFVGTEPFSPTTNAYNSELKRRLPEYGIGLIEIPRLALDGEAVSASRVRERIRAGEWENIARLVPPSSLRMIRSQFLREGNA